MMSESEIITAREAGFFLCHDCHKLIEDRGEKISERCPRCNAAIHLRKPNSLTRTWALVITAAVLAFPANILPIMKVDFLGTADYSTIMDGIIYFFTEGSYGIGIILILLSIHFKWKTWLRHKTLLFRAIEFIGRWSMLDIFVIALLQVLVNFGNLTTIEAAIAATYFTGVVLSTMFAAITFDPRLLWDA